VLYCSDAENSKEGRNLQEIIVVLMKPYFIQRVKIKSLPDEVNNNKKKRKNEKCVSEIYRHNIRMQSTQISCSMQCVRLTCNCDTAYHSF
jgi:hypothetical protein